MSNDAIEALLRAVRPFELCNNLDVSLRACGNCQGCNLTTAAAAQQHIIDREDDEGAEVRTRASVPAMTLRDVFAAAALTGCLAYSRINPMRGNYHENATPDQVAESVYQYADAMLAARAARGEKP